MPVFTDVTLKLTVVPWQKGFDEEMIVADVGRDELTTIVIPFEVTGFPLTHIRLDVIWQVTTSPLLG